MLSSVYLEFGRRGYILKVSFIKVEDLRRLTIRVVKRDVNVVL